MNILQLKPSYLTLPADRQLAIVLERRASRRVSKKAPPELDDGDDELPERKKRAKRTGTGVPRTPRTKQSMLDEFVALLQKNPQLASSLAGKLTKS